MAKARDAFEVSLTEDKKQELAFWLSRELNNALDCRGVSDRDVQYFHQVYEQDRTRLSQNMPWPDAADLTSYLGTEKVDAYVARVMRTIMVSPIWSVEGWGDAAERAPFVEEFHQWQAESEGLQRALYEAILMAFIEPRGTLEVYEDSLTRVSRKTLKVKLALTEDGRPILDDKGDPSYQRRPDGAYVEVTGDETEPQAEIVVDSTEQVRKGPQYRIIPYRDFLVLPGHVANKAEIWGYAKRFHRTVADLTERAAKGMYDPDAIEAIGGESERASETTLAGRTLPVASQEGRTAEKELWEVLFLYDFEGKGEQTWYVATIHKDKQIILRLQHDDIGKPRFVVFLPFPRPGRADEGYSFLGHKLLTIIEEHTAWRNMIADRAALAIQGPIMRVSGALWDPQEIPWGPKAVIDVRDINEIQPVTVPDVPQGAIEREREIKEAAERVSGLSDVVASGLRPESSRTLGEMQIRTEQSYVRMESAIKQIQESMEDLGAIRHEIWKRTLAESADGVAAPESVMTGLESRGINIVDVMPDKKFTASMLEGAFRFKPRGSVETADPARQRMDFNQSLQAIAMVSKVSPMVASFLQTPMGARALYEKWLQMYPGGNKKALLGSMSEATKMLQAQQAAQAQAAQQAAMSGAQPGGQPGAMPAGGPGGPPPPPGPGVPQGIPPQLAQLLGGGGPRG